MLKFHLSLPRSINGQHSHASPEKIIAIGMKFFLDRIQARDEDNKRRSGRMPGLAQDTIHRRPSLIGNGHTLARKVKIRQGFLIVAYNMFMCCAQLLWPMHK